MLARENSEMKQAKGNEAFIVLGDLDEWRTVSVGFELAEVSTDSEVMTALSRPSTCRSARTTGGSLKRWTS